MSQAVLQILSEVRSFLIDLSKEDTEAPLHSVPGASFFREGLGGASLYGETCERYVGLVEKIYSANQESISRRTIENELERAILSTLRAVEDSPATISRAIEDAVGGMSAVLTAQPRQWTSVIPLLGITARKTNWSLGNIDIVDIGSSAMAKFRDDSERIAASGLNVEEVKRHHRDMVQKEFYDTHSGQAFALVTTEAHDAETAWRLAKQQIQARLDCLRFLVGLTFGALQASSISDAQPCRNYRVGLVLDPSPRGSYSVESELDGRGLNTGLGELLERIERNPVCKQFTSILGKPSPTKWQNRLLASVQWMGRASSEEHTRPEHAFLFLAIALESLLLSNQEGEITNRLALGVTHVLGDRLVNRVSTYKQIKHFYRVRSKIVHSGQFKVDLSDLKLFRQYATHVIAELLCSPRFKEMQSSDAFDAWLSAAMCGAGEQNSS